jgi:predicted DNA-binding protein
MPWSEDKALVQIQMEKDMKERLIRLAQEDERSLQAEVRWLIQRGIERREDMMSNGDYREALKKLADKISEGKWDDALS